MYRIHALNYEPKYHKNNKFIIFRLLRKSLHLTTKSYLGTVTILPTCDQLSPIERIEVGPIWRQIPAFVVMVTNQCLVQQTFDEYVAAPFCFDRSVRERPSLGKVAMPLF